MDNNFNFDSACSKAINELGKVNILIAGKTGVGKSTLINAVFGEDLAKTGSGRPVTQKVKEYSREGKPLHIFDTKGLELESFQSLLEDVKGTISSKKTTDASEHIHIAWYCIQDCGEKIEDSEIEFIEELQKEIPVIVVLTKCYGKESQLGKYIENELFSKIHNYVAVLALPYETPIGIVPSKGLDELTKKTYEMVPDAAKCAFAAAQKVNKELIKKSVDKYIKVAAGAAFTAGAVPIPFSDATLLAPIQVGMIAKISRVMGLSLDRAFLTTLITSAAGIVGARYLGKTIVSGLLKLIPGAGSVIGGTISGATAAALTTTMGYAFYKAVDTLLSTGEDFTAEMLAAAFKDNLSK